MGSITRSAKQTVEMAGLAPGLGANLEDISLRTPRATDSDDSHPGEGAFSPVRDGLSVDAYLSVIGDFGPYQIRNYFIVASAWFACAWTTLVMV